MSAYAVPDDEVPAEPPAFDLAALCDEDGRLQWAPDIVLGVDLGAVGEPGFRAAIASRVRRLQAHVHPDKQSGDGRLSR